MSKGWEWSSNCHNRLIQSSLSGTAFGQCANADAKECQRFYKNSNKVCDYIEKGHFFLDDIFFSHLDDSVLAFLKEFQRKSFLNSINLTISQCSPDILMAFASKIVRLFTGITSINILGNTTHSLLGKECPELVWRMLTATRVLDIWSNFTYLP
jgi:hypothetical protein